MILLALRCCCLAVVLTITLYLCLREISLTRVVLPYPSGGNRKQAACTQRVQGSATQRSLRTTMVEEQDVQRPADATEFFSQLGDMQDADAIANSQRLNTLAAWAPTEWMRVDNLDGAMKITAFAFETLEETEDRDSLRAAAKRWLHVHQHRPAAAQCRT